MSDQTSKEDPDVERHAARLADAIEESIKGAVGSWRTMSAEEKERASKPWCLHSMIWGVIVSVKWALGSSRAKIDRLEARVAELEAKPALKYVGIFEEKQTYSPGEFVTCNGSVWYCRSATAGGRPGSSASWQLAVKRGADGKDAR